MILKPEVVGTVESIQLILGACGIMEQVQTSLARIYVGLIFCDLDNSVISYICFVF